MAQLQHMMQARLLPDGLSPDEAAPLLAKMHIDFLQTALVTANLQPVLAKLKAAAYQKSPEMLKKAAMSQSAAPSPAASQTSVAASDLGEKAKAIKEAAAKATAQKVAAEVRRRRLNTLLSLSTTAKAAVQEAEADEAAKVAAEKPVAYVAAKAEQDKKVSVIRESSHSSNPSCRPVCFKMVCPGTRLRLCSQRYTSTPCK